MNWAKQPLLQGRTSGREDSRRSRRAEGEQHSTAQQAALSSAREVLAKGWEIPLGRQEKQLELSRWTEAGLRSALCTKRKRISFPGMLFYQL